VVKEREIAEILAIALDDSSGRQIPPGRNLLVQPALDS
jgi:hypothetical protein